MWHISGTPHPDVWSTSYLWHQCPDPGPESQPVHLRGGSELQRRQPACRTFEHAATERLSAPVFVFETLFFSQAKVQDIKRPHAVVFIIITTSTTSISFRLLKKNLKNVWTRNCRELILQRCPRGPTQKYLRLATSSPREVPLKV